MASKFARSVAASLLWLSLVSADEKAQVLPWSACPAEKGAWCGTLYFTALPANSQNWLHWNATNKNGQTYGSVWPWPQVPPVNPLTDAWPDLNDPLVDYSNFDPAGSNGFMYCYKARASDPCIPGNAPIIRVQPGGKYRITLQNMADKEIPTAGMLGQLQELFAGNIYMNETVTNMSVMYPRHTTNLHIHGLHGSGMGDYDNVLKKVAPGECLTYKYDIPADEPGGTLWYHPHFHGKVIFQMLGGAFGLFIIEDTASLLQRAKTANGLALPNDVVKFLTEDDAQRTLVAYCSKNLCLGNGDPNGAVVALKTNQWHRVRILYADPEAIGKPANFTAFSAGQSCRILELGWDGVYASQVPYPPGVSNPTGLYLAGKDAVFWVHGAMRVDYAIKCTAVGTFTLRYGVLPSTGLGGLVATFNVKAGTPTSWTPFVGTPETSWKPARPLHLQDLSGLTPTHKFYMEPNLTDTPALMYGPTNDTTRRVRFSLEDPLDTVPYGQQHIYEGEFNNIQAHPLHMHQQSFQVIGGCGKVHKAGEFYDTITNTDAADVSCKVRFRMVDFDGVIVFHCHVLDHEDGGMASFFIADNSANSLPTPFKWTNNNNASACCAPRPGKNGKSVCRKTERCGATAGYDTCSNACALSAAQSSCGTGQVCTTDHSTCASVNLKEVCAASDAPKTPTEDCNCSAPVYLWAIVGVSLAVAVGAIVGAVVYVRRHAMSYGDILMEEVNVQGHGSQVRNTPFAAITPEESKSPNPQSVSPIPATPAAGPW